MTKEQILIIKVRYEDEQYKDPHMWDWAGLVNNDQDIEVVNHGKAEIVQEECQT